MTASAGWTGRGGALDPDSWRTPKILLVLVLAVVLVALLTPRRGADGDELSSYSTGESGARLIHDTWERLGWRVERRTTSLLEVPPSDVVNVLLAPRGGPSPAEVHLLLEGVRAGGGLLVAGNVEYLSDSLGYMSGPVGEVVRDTTHCRTRTSGVARVLRLPAFGSSVRWRRPPPSEPVVFQEVSYARQRVTEKRPAVVGVDLGKGRVVIAASAILAANDVLRQCDAALDVAFVRALEFLGAAEGAPRRVVFDEYHHGHGVHPGTLRAVAQFSTSTQSGHALLQAAVAGLILLMASAPRPISPSHPERVIRRSPLEHADALAHAYEAVGATRTVIARLLAGVRRRAGYSRAARSLDDDRFLSMVASSWPSVAGDADHVRRALRSPMRSRELPAAARALERIEAALSTPRNRTA